jgi:hypothetical protein
MLVLDLQGRKVFNLSGQIKGKTMSDYQLTVQDAIDQLMAIDDKTQPLQVEIFDSDGCGLNLEKNRNA